MRTLHFETFVTEDKTGFFGLMLFVLIKIMMKSEGIKFSRWDQFIAGPKEYSFG
jgi:hypothetical protein